MLFFEKMLDKRSYILNFTSLCNIKYYQGYMRGVEPADTVKKFMSIIPKQYRPSFLLKDLLYLNSN